MLSFNTDPTQADHEMEAVLFYLAAFGYIDGHFDKSEREYVDDFILELSEALEPDDSDSAGRARRAALVDRLDRKLQRIDAELKGMWDEPTAEGERAQSFVRARMKLRCFETFEYFSLKDRKTLMDAVDKMLVADGVAHPEEVQFRDELMALVTGKRSAAPPPHVGPSGTRVVIHPHAEWPPTGANDESLAALERHYSKHPDPFKRQLNADVERMDKFIRVLEAKRSTHAGTLAGYQTVQELAGRGSFLDGHVHVIAPTHPAGYELTVLGDLHGCYSCLKAALMQSDFINKVERFTNAPQSHPEPLLVFLGDYIDRGLYSFQGVLRAVLELATTMPRHVIVLRGNHEYYLEKDGQVYGGVRPANALDDLQPYAPVEIFQSYMRLFEAMPNMLLFDDILMVHAGIPRDATLRQHYKDLSSLNHPDIRFQMMWSDPSSVDVVPDDLQASTNRFSFGYEQARAFLHRMGIQTLIRGHEKVNDGFIANYDEPDLRVLTLFSAGGANNSDLPERSSYRKVTPSAMTIRYRTGRADIEPWVIDYASYNDPALNEFFNDDPDLD